MDRQRNRNHDDEQDRWQPVADGLAALLFVSLLLVMLLALYIVRTYEEPEEPQPTEQYTEAYPENHYGGYGGWGGYGSWEPRETVEYSGGGGGGYSEPTEPTETTEPTEPRERYLGDEGPERAAVRVRLLDAETERLIRESGVRFDLYDEWDSLQVLRTYYPERTEFRRFETTENGTFYLPEKLPLTGYYLHEITEPKGYDGLDNSHFLLESAYQWDEPYVVDVRLFPSQNVIRIRLTDAATGESVSGGAYDVFADGDIVTADGTLRFADGQRVDTIRCDENGEGESIALYLGTYLLSERQAPQYYAADFAITAAVTEKRQDEAPEAVTLPQTKTAVNITVCDELYSEQTVADAEFVLYQNGEAVGSARTDRYGQAVLTNLEKGTAYQITQSAAAEGYIPAQNSISVYVDSDGQIEGEAIYQCRVPNRLIRLSVNIRDAMMSGATVSRAVALYDADGRLVDSWGANGIAHVLTGLTPGEYALRVNDGTVVQVQVEDTAQVQTVELAVWSAASVAVLVLTVLAVLLAVFLAIWLRRKKAVKNRGDEHAE